MTNEVPSRIRCDIKNLDKLYFCNTAGCFGLLEDRHGGCSISLMTRRHAMLASDGAYIQGDLLWS